MDTIAVVVTGGTTSVGWNTFPEEAETVVTVMTGAVVEGTAPPGRASPGGAVVTAGPVREGASVPGVIMTVTESGRPPRLRTHRKPLLPRRRESNEHRETTQRFRLAKRDEHARTAFRRAVKQILGQSREEETGEAGWAGGGLLGGAAVAGTGLGRLLTHRWPLRPGCAFRREQPATTQWFLVANGDLQAWTAL